MSKQEENFLKYIKEISLLEQTLHLLEWDSLTGMPKASTEFRSEVFSSMSGIIFEKKNGQEMSNFITFFSNNKEELSPLGLQVYKKAKIEFDLNHNIPKDRYQLYMKTISEADQAWRIAREEKNFQYFHSSLEKIITMKKEFIPLWRNGEKTNYDVLLNQYEPGMTVEKLDAVFDIVKSGIFDIRERLKQEGKEPMSDFLGRKVSKEAQERFITRVITDLGFDFTCGRLDETVHPFMLGLNRKDTRITTRWHENDFKMAVLSCMHEAGHAIYEQNISATFDYTPLATGASMGIHESQSLFNEIIIGGNKTFWSKYYAYFQECSAGQFEDIEFETFYKALSITKASLIRIEADALTYPLHIIIRYEIEKKIFNEGLTVVEIPKTWNSLYEEYLGISPENDLEGVLQDVHWSGGDFGYFPSYALGFIYAAQFAHSMNQEFSFEEVLASNNYSPIQNWLHQNIHQYGATENPVELLTKATGETLNPEYLLNYLKQTFFDAYGIE